MIKEIYQINVNSLIFHIVYNFLLILTLVPYYNWLYHLEIKDCFEIDLFYVEEDKSALSFSSTSVGIEFIPKITSCYVEAVFYLHFLFPS